MQEVSVVHLATGSDIVGLVSYNDDNTITITEPVTPMVGPGQDGRLTVQLMPGRMFVKDKEPLIVSGPHVVYIAPANEQLANSYREMTSNIVIAPASSLSTLLKS